MSRESISKSLCYLELKNKGLSLYILQLFLSRVNHSISVYVCNKTNAGQRNSDDYIGSGGKAQQSW